MVIGVLALQGAFKEHIQMFEKCGVQAIEIRKKEQLSDIEGLVIPGGESTTIGKLMVDWELLKPVKEKAFAGLPIFGTCAGMVLLAKDIENSDQPRLGLMEVTVSRNAYGRQVDSFEADLNINVLNNRPFKGIFIRAPYIEKANADVKIMAEHEGKAVMARQGKLLSCAFHPELTDDLRIHEYFLKMTAGSE